MTKLDRLARSLTDARAIADELTAGQVRLNLGGSVYDLTDPVGRLLLNVLATLDLGPKSGWVLAPHGAGSAQLRSARIVAGPTTLAPSASCPSGETA